jgi:predicted  nucleic acid-binding Zn-ribbon protein
MSITSNTGIDFPNDSLEQADKSTLIQIISQLTDELSDVKAELSDVREDSDRLSRKVAKTKAELSDVREDTDRVSKKIADTNSRVSDLEENTDVSDTSESDNSTDNSEGSDGESSALKQVCALTDKESKEHLSTNQSRARKVALRINEYGRSCPAGVSLSFRSLRDVLTAQEDSRAHYQTVRRVAEFLSEFGSDGVDITETRGGKTVVVFRERLVDSLTDVVTSEDTTAASPVLI